MGANLRKKGELSKNILTLLRFCTNLNKILSDVFCNFVTS